MNVKSFVLLAVLFTSDINGFKYSNLAGGWLKLNGPASWIDASVQCHFQGAVLASPLNSQIRDAIKDYVRQAGQPNVILMTGVKADYGANDYISREGVNIYNMTSVIFDNNNFQDFSDSCVMWLTNQAELKPVSCQKKLPFVCYRRRVTVEVAGCGTQDKGYEYEARSGSCYKFHRHGMTWSEAYTQCNKEGANLTIVNNQLENIVLTELFAKHPSSVIEASPLASPDFALVGFRDWLDGKSWKTIEVQTLSEAGFDDWAKGEPNNSGGVEQCGTIFRKGNYNDGKCDVAYAFICEKKPVILTHPM